MRTRHRLRFAATRRARVAKALAFAGYLAAVPSPDVAAFASLCLRAAHARVRTEHRGRVRALRVASLAGHVI